MGTSTGQTTLKVSGYCLMAYAAQGSRARSGGLGSGGAYMLESRALENPLVFDQSHSRPRLNLLTALFASSWL